MLPSFFALQHGQTPFFLFLAKNEYGGPTGTRTLMRSRAGDFKSPMSANSIIEPLSYFHSHLIIHSI